MSSEGETSPPTHPGAQFTTTHWSVVLEAGRPESPAAARALEQLCRAYWYPLYAYVRRRGYGPHEAQDLTQSFFARLLEKNYVGQADRQRGTFRTFLLSAVSHFLADEWDRAHRIKRGGGLPVISFDSVAAEDRYRLEPVEPSDPARLFDRRWATTLLDHALARLESEFIQRDQTRLFEALRPFLLGEQGEVTCAEAAARLEMTAAAVKMAVSRMRARCREILREEILQTTASPEEADEEYRALRSVLAQ